MEALAGRPPISPTVMRPAWKALKAHYKRVRKSYISGGCLPVTLRAARA